MPTHSSSGMSETLPEPSRSMCRETIRMLGRMRALAELGDGNEGCAMNGSWPWD